MLPLPSTTVSPPGVTCCRLTRELEKYGAAASASAGREHIGYVIEGTKLQAAEITEMLLDSVLNMR